MNVKQNAGFVLAEVLLWIGFVALGTLLVQIRVTTHWKKNLEALQGERLPFTGRRSLK